MLKYQVRASTSGAMVRRVPCRHRSPTPSFDATCHSDNNNNNNDSVGDHRTVIAIDSAYDYGTLKMSSANASMETNFSAPSPSASSTTSSGVGSSASSSEMTASYNRSTAMMNEDAIGPTTRLLDDGVWTRHPSSASIVRHPSTASSSTASSCASASVWLRQHRSRRIVSDAHQPRPPSTAMRTAGAIAVSRRSNSLGSMNSFDSGGSTGASGGRDMGYLRVFTAAIKADTDYVTLKVSATTTCRSVVERILHKFRLSFRDANLFQLWMEIRTRMYNGDEVKSILELEKESRPLELERCHPPNMSRFILSMVSNAIQVRIFDGDICPQSNYKSVLISRHTTCHEALRLMLRMCRVIPPTTPMLSDKESGVGGGEDCGSRKFDSTTAAVQALEEEQCKFYRLFVEETSNLKSGKVTDRGKSGGHTPLTPIPADCQIAGVFLGLMPTQRIVLRRVVNSGRAKK